MKKLMWAGMSVKKSIECLKEIEEKYIDGNEIVDAQRRAAINMAITALEKQVPKQTKLILKTATEKSCDFECPGCRIRFCRPSAAPRPQHCVICGQALDWSI